MVPNIQQARTEIDRLEKVLVFLCMSNRCLVERVGWDEVNWEWG